MLLLIQLIVFFSHFCASSHLWVQGMMTNRLKSRKYPWNECGSGWLSVGICSFLTHSLLKVNLNQGRFSLLDSGHFFMSKVIKAIQAHTCHITRKIPRVPFSLQSAVSSAITVANGWITLLELLFYQSQSRKIPKVYEINVQIQQVEL